MLRRNFSLVCRGGTTGPRIYLVSGWGQEDSGVLFFRTVVVIGD
jgi:hypothetical protein